MSGVLYGVGVGPGDPELLTVKAWRLISTAKIIAYLSANGGESTARNIAAPFMPDDITEIVIDMPMQVDPAPALAVYDSGSARIAEHLSRGDDVVMLCEGDPFFYGSFMYIHVRLAHRFTCLVVPGVTSLTASAAVLGVPLAARSGVIKVLPATLDASRLRDEIATSQSTAIIKVGRHFAKVRDVLAELDLLQCATAIEKATQAGQRIRAVTDIGDDSLPYFTTILVNAGRPHS
jgi:precorrin-2/cobalt-factor-2 C20-methyltransferase